MSVGPKPETKAVNIDWTCAEIGGLWSAYLQETMAVCFLTYFVHHLQDAEIVPLAQEALDLSRKRVDKMKAFFQAENFPVPAGFSENDVNLAAPPLFLDSFSLSFVYMMNRLSMISYSFIASSTVRLDVLDFFNECLRECTEMFGKAVRMLLEKGLYDRPPFMNYPEQVEYVQKESFLDGIWGRKRRLSAVELTEIFFNIERNYFSVTLMLGFAQVLEDKNLRDLALQGKKISEHQIDLFNTLLQEEDLLGVMSVNMVVTDSTASPFSEKLILAMIHTLNSVDIVLIAHALSLAMRADLAANYSRLIAQIMAYGKDTFDAVVERRWLEQPPLTTDRKQLMKS
ncbi:DUF3231 family protein [Cohnella caldifontis]|uniref:DUF3231 family protein n=1 Tax=Cohnella caldifontis TaxID=3027471 RepID=UPI0023ED5DAB|nr:DUF3231 family protein [Cohnella sp. YIM B05605]